MQDDQVFGGVALSLTPVPEATSHKAPSGARMNEKKAPEKMWAGALGRVGDFNWISRGSLVPGIR